MRNEIQWLGPGQYAPMASDGVVTWYKVGEGEDRTDLGTPLTFSSKTKSDNGKVTIDGEPFRLDF